MRPVNGILEHCYLEDAFMKTMRVLRVLERPIVIPNTPDTDLIPYMEDWKWFCLAHWYTLAFRGRLSARDYARKHGVSAQAVGWLARNGRLGELTRDAQGGYWIPEDLPYPELRRVGGMARRGGGDASVRALHRGDFRIGGVAVAKTDRDFEAYCRIMKVGSRPTMKEVFQSLPVSHS